MLKKQYSLLDYLRGMSGSLHLDYLSGTRNTHPSKAKRLLKRLKEKYPRYLVRTVLLDEDYPYRYCLKIPLWIFATGKYKKFLSRKYFSLYLCPKYKNLSQVAFRINPFYLKFLNMNKFANKFKEITGKNLQTLFTGSKITELHFAIDIHEIHFYDVIVWYKYQKSLPIIKPNGKYFGSRFSQIALVAYSKSDQQEKKHVIKSQVDWELALSSELTRIELRWRDKNGGSYSKYTFDSLTEFHFPFEKLYITHIDQLKKDGVLSSKMIENILRFGVQDTFSKFPRKRKILSKLIINNCYFNKMRGELTEQLHTLLSDLIEMFK